MVFFLYFSAGPFPAFENRSPGENFFLGGDPAPGLRRLRRRGLGAPALGRPALGGEEVLREGGGVFAVFFGGGGGVRDGRFGQGLSVFWSWYWVLFFFVLLFFLGGGSPKGKPPIGPHEHPNLDWGLRLLFGAT